MKKHLKFICLAAVAMAAALSSCQKQDQDFLTEDTNTADGTRANSDFTSYYAKEGVDWSKADEYAATSKGAVKSMAVTYKKDYIYMLLKVDPKSSLLSSGHKYDNYLWVYVYDKSASKGDWNLPATSLKEMRGWMFYKGNPKFQPKDSRVEAPKVRTVNGLYYYEIRYKRSISSLLQDKELHIGVKVVNSYRDSSDSIGSGQSFCPSDKKDGGYKMYWLNMAGTTTTPTDPNHCSDIGITPMLMAYVPHYRNTPTTADAKKLTHINYFSAKIASDGKVSIVEEKWDKTDVTKVLKLKASNSQLKVLLSIGGEGSGPMFEQLFINDNYINNFCSTCSTLVNKKFGNYTLDGIDIDWENLKPGDSNQQAQFNRLVRKLRNAIGNKKIISFAAPSAPSAIDWNEAMKYLDYVNVMTYDMNWSNPYRYHHSALYPSKSGFAKSDGGGYYNSCSSVMKAFIKEHKVPANKLNLGVAFYARCTSDYFIWDDEDEEWVVDPGYNLIYSYLKGSWNSYVKWDKDAKVPYVQKKSGKDFLGYENKESVNIKGQYAKQNDLLGVMFWDYGQDYNHELLDALQKGLSGSNIGGNSVQSSLPL